MPVKIFVILNPPPKNLQKWVDDLVPKLRQFKRPLKKSALLMRQSIDKNFVTQGRPEAWKELAPSTVARKGHGLILFETGKLKNSIKAHAPTNKEAKVTSATPYGHYHQSGTSRMIARPFMLFQESDVKNITNYFIVHIKNKIQFYQKRLSGGFSY